MGLLDFIFGWNRKVLKLRKKWDRLREKSLKKGQPIKRVVLKKMDAINLNLTTLEEQSLKKYERLKLYKTVEIDLAEIEGMLESKQEDFREA